MKKKAGTWTAILAGGALLAILGATAANTSDTGSGIGMIVFGLLIASVGLSGLLGVLYDPDATGLMFAFFGILMPTSPAAATTQPAARAGGRPSITSPPRALRKPMTSFHGSHVNCEPEQIVLV